MSTRTWTGGAAPIAQVQTYAFAGTWETTDVVRATIGTKSYDFVAGSTVVATVLSTLVTAWNALATGYPEFAEVTASADATTLTLTADTAGKPFTVTLTPLETGGGGADAQTIEGAGAATTGTAATAPTGPNYWSVAGNWAENSVPVTGDDVVIDKGPSIKYGTDQNAVTLATLKVGPNYPASSEIGLPWNTNAQAPESGYPEYRQQRLKIGATAVDVDSTSRRLRFDFSPASTTVVIRNSGQPATTAEDAVDLKATTTANVHVLKGSVGVNNVAGDTGTVADLNVSFRTSVAGDCVVRCGSGCTVTNLDMSGGQVFLKNGATTVVKTDGTLTLEGAVGTSLKNRGGVVYLDGTGTVTLLENAGECYRRGFQAVTITTLRLFAGGRGGDPNGTATYTNATEFYECRMAAGPDDRGDGLAYWDFGRHRKYTVAVIP